MSNKNPNNQNDKIKARNDRIKFLTGLFFFLLAIYLIISFISFFFTWKTDQSFEWGQVLSNSTVVVENWAGKLGARISNLFIAKWFGVASFALPFVLLVIALKLFNIRLLPIKKTIIYSVLGMILLSLILGFLFGNMNGYLVNGLGGSHGMYLSDWFNSLIGKTGTAFLYIIFISAYILSLTQKTLTQLKQEIGKIFRQQFLKSIVSFVAKEEGNNPQTNLQTEGNKTGKKEKQDSGFTFVDTRREQKEETEETGSKKETETHQRENRKEEETTDKEDEEIKLTIEKSASENGSDAQNSQTVKDYDPTLELSQFELPPIEILEEYDDEKETQINKDEIIRNKNKIVETLGNYKIQIDQIKATVGPTITLYEIVPAPGIRISKIKNLEDDIALNLAALGIRIIAPIPGRGTIGIEVPNQHPEIVSMRSIMSSRKFQESTAELPIALGKTISNETYLFDLSKMPHILVAGATGQGKSVGINVVITSLLYKKHPSQLKFVFVDPKKVELNLYSVLEKHYLAKLPNEDEPVITDIQKVKYTLNSLNVEMDQRYDLLKKAHARNIKEYNRKFISRKLNPEKGHRFMPYIVMVIDEFADLIMTAGKEIELPIARIAQLARAVGIHMIIATQRPSTNIITGVIKANFPARIAFKVASMIDSRTILDTPGANQLIGKGDMLISSGSEMTRVQCAFVDTPEVEKLCSFISDQQGFTTAFMLPEYVEEEEAGPGEVDMNNRDELFNDAARVVVINQMGSTSMIQRKFSIGYNRAGRIMDQLEAAGVVGPSEGSKARQVLIQDEYSLEQLLNSLN